jgi:uncharacterized protein with NRDE domain
MERIVAGGFRYLLQKMCLFCFVGTDGAIASVAVSNRDEYFSRAKRTRNAELKLHDNGLIGVAEDKRATWLAVEPKSGRLATVLNTGYKQGGRGVLISHVLNESFSSGAKLPEVRGHYNLLWGSLSYPPNFTYSSNFGNSSKIRTYKNLDSFACANDLFQDEYCKVPYVQHAIESCVRNFNETLGDKEPELFEIEQIRDRVISSFCSTRMLCSYFESFLKWTTFNRNRRIQPGMRTSLFSFLIVFALISLFSSISSLSAIAMSLALAVFVGFFFHHNGLQAPFVRVPGYGTISQICVITTKNGNGYFFYRDTSTQNFPDWQLLCFQLSK